MFSGTTRGVKRRVVLPTRDADLQGGQELAPAHDQDPPDRLGVDPGDRGLQARCPYPEGAEQRKEGGRVSLHRRRCSMRRTPSTKKIRSGTGAGGGRTARHVGLSTVASTSATGSSASATWMAASYSGAKGSRRRT